MEKELESLDLPKLTPGALLGHLGPGLVLMMTGVGTSHLVTAPVAGGRFGFDLLWCIGVAYVFKYYGFEMAFRFTSATGKSLLDAYATAWKKWPLWYVLVATLVQCAVGQAGRLIAAAAVVYYFFAQYLQIEMPIACYALALGLFSVTVILSGRYGAVELVAKTLAGLLCASCLAIYFVKPAPLSALRHFLILQAPPDSWLIIAALLGLMPTGIDVSLQASEWGKAKRVGAGRIREHLETRGWAPVFDPFAPAKPDLALDLARLPPQAREYCRRWFKIGLWDFRLGHLLSFLIASLFLLLAAVWLYPSAVQGREVMGEIAGIFTRSVGPWMMVAFLAGAFAATFSTAFNYFDGWPRVVAACCRNLFRSTSGLAGIGDASMAERRRRWYSEYNIYRLTMLFSLVASVAVIAGLPRPVWLVLLASALAFLVAPAIFALNLYYCFSVLSRDDKIFYPSSFAKWFSWGSMIVFSVLTGVLVLARWFGIGLLGA